tara:strand:- start:211 stop:837 length:627 start_codon:yes stop_codon:yes gene_type:complete
MYTLYSIPGTCSTGITVLLEKLGVAYDVVQREDVPNYAEIVPTNQVPALKTEDGEIITEGAAIVLYLLIKHKSDMMPSDLAKKTEFLQWLMFNYATLHPAYSKIFAVAFKIETSEEERVNLIRQFSDAVSKLWAILDKRLEGRQYIVGNQPTIIDYLVTVYSSWMRNLPEADIKRGANVERLIDEIAALPEFQAAYAKESTEFQKKAA